MITYGCELEFRDETILRREECKEKAKILNLARKGKMVILLEWDRLKPLIFLDIR